MDTSNVSGDVKLSAEVMAAAFNIADLDSTFYKEVDGEKVLISQKEIDSVLLKKFGEKINSLITKEVKSLTSELEGKAKREIYTELERKAEQDLGVKMNWSKDGFSKIKEHLSQGEPLPIEKQEQYIATVQEYEKRLKELTENHNTELSGIKAKEVNSNVDNYLVDLFSKEESLLTVRDLEVLKNHAALVRKDLQNEDTFLNIVDGKPILVDAKGDEKLNKENGFQPYDFDKLSLDLVKSRYNPEAKGKDISSPNPANSDPLKEVKTKSGLVKVPQFKTAEQAIEYMEEAERNGDFDMVKAIGENLQNLNS